MHSYILLPVTSWSPESVSIRDEEVDKAGLAEGEDDGTPVRPPSRPVGIYDRD